MGIFRANAKTILAYFIGPFLISPIMLILVRNLKSLSLPFQGSKRVKNMFHRFWPDGPSLDIITTQHLKKANPDDHNKNNESPQELFRTTMT